MKKCSISENLSDNSNTKNNGEVAERFRKRKKCSISENLSDSSNKKNN